MIRAPRLPLVVIDPHTGVLARYHALYNVHGAGARVERAQVPAEWRGALGTPERAAALEVFRKKGLPDADV